MSQSRSALRAICAAALLLAGASPALAAGHEHPPAPAGAGPDWRPPEHRPMDPRPEWRGPKPDAHVAHGSYDGRAQWDQARADWLGECRRRMSEDRWDHRRRRDRDRGYDEAAAYCQSYLDYYSPAGLTYVPMTMMVPARMVPVAGAAAAPQEPCIETEVIEEWVPEPAAQRIIPRRPVRQPQIRDKRIKLVPDKRVRTN